jgi:glycine oxidase
VLEADSIAAGASGVGFGLANPMMSRKGRPVWRVHEALAALEEMGCSGRRGILRPAKNEEQADYFIESCGLSPDIGAWVSPESASEQFPFLTAPFGLISIPSGIAVQMASQVRSWLEGIDVRENTRVKSWRESGQGVELDLADGSSLSADRLVLCSGSALLSDPKTQHLNLHGIKGQTIRVRKPAELPEPLPSLSGFGYVVDEGNSVLTIGGGFEHQWSTPLATPEATTDLLNTVAHLIKGIDEAEIIEQSAAIRMTVPGTRLPMIGPLSSSGRAWIFTGLGSKGILMAALLGENISRFFSNPLAIPPACGVVRRGANS